MNDLLRPEQSHAINGAPGRFLTLRVPPASWKLRTFANQRWISERRPIEGYGADATLQVEIRFDDEFKNGQNSFAITAEVRIPRRHDIGARGCLHTEIAEVFPELSHLIRWHLVSTDGPMHYIANTVYHADEHGPTRAWVYFKGPSATDPLGLGNDDIKERLLGYLNADKAREAEAQPGYTVKWDEKTIKVQGLDHARSSAVWPDATDAQLSVPKEELTAALNARLPALMQAFRADIEAAGFVWAAPTIA